MLKFKVKATLSLFVIGFFLSGVLFTFAMWYAAEGVQFMTVAIHSFIGSLLLTGLLLLLNLFFSFAHFDLLPPFQQIFNCLIIFALSLFIWFGLSYLFDYIIFGVNVAAYFCSFYPFWGLLALCLYINLLQMRFFDKQIQHAESLSTDNVIETLQSDEAIELIERITVKMGQKIHVILVEDIYFIQADGDYVQLHTKNGKYLKEQTMKYFQENLSSKQFVRVHRSTIVNISYVSRIEQFDKQTQLLILNTGERIRMSVLGYRALRVALGL